jgi:hypothetical protein
MVALFSKLITSYLLKDEASPECIAAKGFNP